MGGFLFFENFVKGSSRMLFIQPLFFCNQKKPGKACEARPVGETASKVWRRGQNIQGAMPQNILVSARVCFAGANCRGEGVSLAVLPPFLCAVKEMGVNITNNNPTPFFRSKVMRAHT